MKKSEFTKDCHGESRFFSLWDVQSPKAVVAIVHGLGEHIGRYDWVASKLNEAGYAVIGLDLVGHGKSSGKRGHAPSFERLYQDLDCLTAEATKLAPDAPKILFGHSMGGLIAALYLQNHDFIPTAAIFSSAGFAPAFKPNPIKVLGGKLLYYIAPSLAMNNELDVNGLSHDLENIKTYLSDPLNHDRLTARLGLDILALGQVAIDDAAKITCPAYVLHGSADKITSHDQSQAFAKNMGVHCHFESHPNGFHEILNDFEKEEAMTKILSWIELQLPS